MALPAELPAVILAGGLGTRLRSVVADRPKVMARVCGRPFLAWWLDCLERQGVREVILCLGYRAGQVRHCFGARYRGLSLAYSTEPAPLGTGGALRHALPWVGADVFLALNGDSFCEADLGGFWRAHQARSAPASILMTRVPDTRRFGCIRVDQNGRIIGFAEKGEQRGPGWINAGVYLLARRLFQALPPGQSLSLERDLLPCWLAGGVYGFPAQGRFIDIGTPESYALAEDFFAASNSLAA